MNADGNVGLFANERESNLASTVAMVEAALRQLGHVVDGARVASPGAERAWRVVKGSAEIAITILGRDGGWHMRVAAAVMTLDPAVDTAKLFHRLLELNAEMIGAGFALHGAHVILVSQRPTLDLDQSEVAHQIESLQSYADDWDDKLVAEFGGTLGSI